jgi:CheY-like chemotaxis protein
VIDRDLHRARALLVESNPILRSLSSAQLRDLGLGHVAQVSRARDARLLLERERFDIVVCTREFEDTDLSGQDLLDELRREQLLPHSTVFLMVTANASYHQVVEAAESALDGLLVRPYSGAVFGARLMEARNRKRELDQVLHALDAGETEVALVRAVKRFQEKQPYWLYCGRLAAELLLSLARPDDALKIFERVSQAKPGASWARLGAARCQMATGNSSGARKTIAEVLAAEPGSADGCELLGRILVEQCDFDAALAQYRIAADLTPGCLLRAQHAGALAFYQGQGDEALRFLERSLGMGVQSKLFDALSLLMLALLRFDMGDAKGLALMRAQLKGFRERYADSRRLQRFDLAAGTLVALLGPDPVSALPALTDLSSQALRSDFDLEAANMLLALWARVPPSVCVATGHEEMLERIGMRFSVSKAIVEVLLASSRRAEPALSVIRRCHARVTAISQEAMELTLRGDHGGAAQLLLQHGEQTLNAKLLELAGAVARKNRATVPNADELAERAAAIVRNSCQAVNHIAGLQRSGRSPGGLQLRGRNSTTADATD